MSVLGDRIKEERKKLNYVKYLIVQWIILLVKAIIKIMKNLKK